MPRPDPRAPRLGQLSMFDAAPEPLPTADPGRLIRGRHSQAVDVALDAAHAAGLIDDIDAALATVVRAGAWALDAGEATNRPYLPAKTVPAMTEAIRELGLTPESRKADTNDEINRLLADLATVDTDDNSTRSHSEG